MSEVSPVAPDEVLFFLHIPKTAGVSVYEVLDANFAPEEIFPVPDAVSSEKMFRELSPSQLAKIRLVRGHFWFGPGDRGVYDFLVPDPKTITFLRDPVDRTVSLFQFVMRHPELWLAKRMMRPEVELLDLADVVLDEAELGELQSLDLEQFVRHPEVRGELRNLQARLVVGRSRPGVFRNGDDPSRVQRLSDAELLDLAMERLEEFAFVGLTERLDESVTMLTRMFGWPEPGEIPQLNAADSPSRSYDISAGAREAIREQVAVDMELYAHACSLFESRSAAKLSP